MKYSFIVALGLMALTAVVGGGCRINKERTKSSSPLHEKLGQASGFGVHPQARKIILDELPLGSPEKEVREYIKRTFSGGIRDEHEIADKYMPQNVKELEYICVRAESYVVFPVGSNWTDIIFFLDDERSLEEVIVASSGNSL